MRKTGGQYTLTISMARLVDEYVTIQNPDEDWNPKNPMGPHSHYCDNICPASVREWMKGEGEDDLLPLLEKRKAASRLSGHIVLLTADDEIVLQKRPDKKVATSPGELTSSMGSGFDWGDVNSLRAKMKALGNINRLDYTKWVRRGLFLSYILRELKEELGIDEDHLSNLKVVAIVRDLRRSGQPTVLMIGRTDMTFRELHAYWSRQRKLSSNLWLHPYWVLWNRFIMNNRGRDHWEFRSLIAYEKKISPISLSVRKGLNRRQEAACTT